jgi:hypothetical protein
VTIVLATRAAGGVYRSYARGAAAAFSLVVAYTVLNKMPSGEFARDWMHTAVHVATASVAVYAGWISERGAAAKAFTAAIAVGYGALGIFGWFTDGLLMDSTFRIPLDAGGNVFHLALGVAAAVTVAAAALPQRAP